MDKEIDTLIDLQPRENASNSDVEVFVGDGDKESKESSESCDEETASNADSEAAPPNPLRWSNTLSAINLEELSVGHGPSRVLGDNAPANLFSSMTNSLMKLPGTALPMPIPRATKRS